MFKKSYYFFSFLLVFSFFSQTTSLCAYDQFCYSSSNKNPKLKILSSITSLAQAATWLNEEQLAIGRWDGTITLFSCKDSLSISQALLSPIKQGITMLERINDFSFISSNGPSSIALWEQRDKEYILKAAYNFSTHFGSVDSARLVKIENKQILLTGHSEGYLLIWSFTNEGLSLVNSINLQSKIPLDSPYKLWNIRGISLWKKQLIVTASEDGDLCIVDILKGHVVHRQKYNEYAKRGINHIFISGDYLFLSNCSVGPLDQNLWLYRIEKDKFVYLDSKNLVSNEDLQQVFGFDVASIFDGDNTYFFCTTEEGLLWFGQIQDESLQVSGSKKISSQGGAVLAIHPLNNRLASISYDIHLLEVSLN